MAVPFVSMDLFALATVPTGPDEAKGTATYKLLRATGQPLIGRHLTFVPLGGIKIGPDDLQVAVSREQVEDAPDIEQRGEELSQADESALYHHYELNYTPPDTQSGRRLARR
jgi:hypothetical protein